MGLLNQLLNCEFSYCQLLSEREEDRGIIEFSDRSNPDLPMQNYTYITRDLSPKEFGSVICSRENNLDKDSTFIKFVFDPYQPYPGDIPELENYRFKKTLMLIYDLRNIEPIYSEKPEKCTNKPTFNDYLQLEKTLLSDKSLNHIEKWYNLAQNLDELEIITYSKNLEARGRCDLYYYRNVAKIEDIEVLRKYRGKGVGKELLSYSIHLAAQRGKNFVYLTCDGELGDYYLKQGFSLYSEFNTFIKYY